jgi:hypothetical protein
MSNLLISPWNISFASFQNFTLLFLTLSFFADATAELNKPFLSMHNYTPLVISGNGKNKQLTLLSQCKLPLPEEICEWLCKFGGTSLKIKKEGVMLIQA